VLISCLAGYSTPFIHRTFWLKFCLVIVKPQSGTSEQPILLVENSEDDILLITRAFQRAGVTRRFQPVTSGMDAIGYFKGEPPFGDRDKYPLPGLVLLDIKMPGTDGFEVNQQDKIYRKNLGPKTTQLAQRIETYDPDTSWAPAE
jgi:CheY-like chemotaxis protein